MTHAQNKPYHEVLWHLDIFRRSFRELNGHLCMAESCIFCALKELFAQLQYSHESALPPDALRRALAETFHQRRFQLGGMDDAAECFENILRQIHFHIASQESEDMCSASHCIPHQKFAMTLVEQTVCHACGATSEPLSFTQMVHYVSTSSLCSQAELMVNQHRDPADVFGQLLRKAGGMGDTRECPSTCGAKMQICRVLMNHPEIVSIGLIWDSERPTLERILEVLKSIGMVLKIQDMFHSVVDNHWASATKHHLVGIVTYYGKHYSTFFFHTKLRVWIYFDDATVREIGSKWEQVIEKCRRGHFQPLLLLYANPNGSSIFASTAPKHVTMADKSQRDLEVSGAVLDTTRYNIVKDNYQLQLKAAYLEHSYENSDSVKSQRSPIQNHFHQNILYPSQKLSMPDSCTKECGQNYFHKHCLSFPKSDSNVPCTQRCSQDTIDHHDYGQSCNGGGSYLFPHTQNVVSSRGSIPSDNSILPHILTSESLSINHISTSNDVNQSKCPQSFHQLSNDESLCLSNSTEPSLKLGTFSQQNFKCIKNNSIDSNTYINRKAVESVLTAQKLKRHKSLYGNYCLAVGNRNSSSSLESFDSNLQTRDKTLNTLPNTKGDITGTANVVRRRDSGNWSGDHNSASSSSSGSLDSPYFYIVGNKKSTASINRHENISGSMRDGQHNYMNIGVFPDQGYDSFSLSSTDSYPSVTGSPSKLDPRLDQIPEDLQTICQVTGILDPSVSEFQDQNKCNSETKASGGDCDKLCAEADILLIKSHEMENEGDLVLAAMLSDSAAAKARAAMDAPYNNAQSLVSAKMKHSFCVMRSSSLHKRLKEAEVEERRKQKDVSNSEGQHSRQSGRDNTHGRHSRQGSKDGSSSSHSRQGSKDGSSSSHSRQGSKDGSSSSHSRQGSKDGSSSSHSRQGSKDGSSSSHSRQGSKDGSSSSHSRQGSKDGSSGCHNRQGSKDNSSGKQIMADFDVKAGRTIELYATLPKKSSKRKSPTKSIDESHTCTDFVEKHKESSKDEVTSQGSDQMKVFTRTKYKKLEVPSEIKVQTKKIQELVEHCLVPKDHNVLDSSNKKDYNKKATLHRTWSGQSFPKVENVVKSEDLQIQANEQSTKKQHKIRRKLMGGFMKRKNRSLPDLREGQNQNDPRLHCFDDFEVVKLPLSSNFLDLKVTENSENPTDQQMSNVSRGFHQPHRAFIKKNSFQQRSLVKVNPPHINEEISQLSPDSTNNSGKGDIDFPPPPPDHMLLIHSPDALVSFEYNSETKCQDPPLPPPPSEFSSSSNGGEIVNLPSQEEELTSEFQQFSVHSGFGQLLQESKNSPMSNAFLEEIQTKREKMLQSSTLKKKNPQNVPIKPIRKGGVNELKNQVTSTRPQRENVLLQELQNKQFQMLQKKNSEKEPTKDAEAQNSENYPAVPQKIQKNYFETGRNYRMEDNSIKLASEICQSPPEKNFEVLKATDTVITSGERHDESHPVKSCSVKNLASKFELMFKSKPVKETKNENNIARDAICTPNSFNFEKKNIFSDQNIIKSFLGERHPLEGSDNMQKSLESNAVHSRNRAVHPQVVYTSSSNKTSLSSGLTYDVQLVANRDTNSDSPQKICQTLKDVLQTSSESERPEATADYSSAIQGISNMKDSALPQCIGLNQNGTSFVDEGVFFCTSKSDQTLQRFATFSLNEQQHKEVNEATKEMKIFSSNKIRNQHPKRRTGTKKSVTFSDQVVLVACAEDEAYEHLPNPLLERVYKQHLQEEYRRTLNGLCVTNSATNGPLRDCTQTNTSEQNLKQGTLTTSDSHVCGLCYRKKVSSPNVHCLDCTLYISKSSQ
ncbi:uncharacterized protein LOC143254375 isoform X2 [Tachypleus tridentatus]|uniref:uncharacterized protein LOC143254375 isoform X2 n=1 Tax=Tachypleus tridentatus TaxID=6853 RepID=UPI003FD2A947